jgi:hypothetical protein
VLLVLCPFFRSGKHRNTPLAVFRLPTPRVLAPPNLQLRFRHLMKRRNMKDEHSGVITLLLFLKLQYDQTQIIFRLWKPTIVQFLPHFQVPKTASPQDTESRHDTQKAKTLEGNPTIHKFSHYQSLIRRTPTNPAN